MFKTKGDRPLQTRTRLLKWRHERVADAIDLGTQSEGFLEAHRHAQR